MANRLSGRALPNRQAASAGWLGSAVALIAIYQDSAEHEDIDEITFEAHF